MLTNILVYFVEAPLHGVSADKRLAAGDMLIAHQHLERRSLAGAVNAQQAEAFAVAYTLERKFVTIGSYSY